MVNEHTEYSRGVGVPVEAIQIIDPSVLASKYPLRCDLSIRRPNQALELPDGTIITNITAHGASFWGRTARLDTILNDEPKEYFLKVNRLEFGQ
jgi:hypothetical protein